MEEQSNKHSAKVQLDPNIKLFFEKFFAKDNLSNPITWFSFGVFLSVCIALGNWDFFEFTQILIFGTGLWYVYVAWRKIQILAVLSGLATLLNCPLFHLDHDIVPFVLCLSGGFFIIYWLIITGFYKNFSDKSV